MIYGWTTKTRRRLRRECIGLLKGREAWSSYQKSVRSGDMMSLIHHHLAGCRDGPVGHCAREYVDMGKKRTMGSGEVLRVIGYCSPLDANRPA